MSVAEASVVLMHSVGLHARPAVKLTQAAARYRAAVHLRVGLGGDWVDAKSVIRVIGLEARSRSVLHFRADGIDAEAAVSDLVRLVERDFDEQPAG